MEFGPVYSSPFTFTCRKIDASLNALQMGWQIKC